MCPECGEELRAELRAGPDKVVVPARLILWANLALDLVALSGWLYPSTGLDTMTYIKQAWRASPYFVVTLMWTPLSLALSGYWLMVLNRHRFIGLTPKMRRRTTVVCAIVLLVPAGIGLARWIYTLLR
jgi:hypothetical protein